MRMQRSEHENNQRDNRVRSKSTQKLSKRNQNDDPSIKLLLKLNLEYTDQFHKFTQLINLGNKNLQPNQKEPSYVQLFFQLKNLHELLVKHRNILQSDRTYNTKHNQYQHLATFIHNNFPQVLSPDRPKQGLTHNQVQSFISIVAEMRTEIEYHGSKISEYEQQGESRRYENELNGKMIQMTKMLQEQQQKHVQGRNKLQKLMDEYRKANDHYERIRKKLVQKQIILRSLQK